MKSSFGWTLLSRDALRRAETQLRDDVEGVRDEIGFLSLHQAYADRFFPGTSVLHTRLRYVLFVPWIYGKVAEQREHKSIADAIEGKELELTRRLKESGEMGIIGGRNYPNPTSQPPSMIYWSALGTWRILRSTPGGSTPSRQTVHRGLARKPIRQQLHDDDKQLLTEEEPLFSSIPQPPPAWNDATQRLDFRLEDRERTFLRNCFLSIPRLGTDNVPSLLASLVEQRVTLSDQITLWSPRVRAAADRSDRDALNRARQAAALSAVGRGVYAALVEEMRAGHDGIPTEDFHRAKLDTIASVFRADALELDVDAVVTDAPTMSGGILDILRATQSWLRTPTRSLSILYAPYARAETRRKGQRARLAKTPAGRERRTEWVATEHPDASPLHYRWGNVRQLLMDLQEAP
ncbi:MAG: DUF6361 family protein [Gemmataceae bacterium]